MHLDTINTTLVAWGWVLPVISGLIACAVQLSEHLRSKHATPEDDQS